MTNRLLPDHFTSRTLSVSLLVLASFACAAASSALVAVPGQPASAKGLVTAVQKSNGSKVIVRYKVEDSAIAGQPAIVSLVFSAVTDASASVRFTSDAGLRLLAAQAPVPLPLGSSELEIQAVMQADGLYYLNVFTTQNGVTSAMSIPVTTGSGKPALGSMGETKPSQTGEKIISVPVR